MFSSMELLSMLSFVDGEILFSSLCIFHCIVQYNRESFLLLFFFYQEVFINNENIAYPLDMWELALATVIEPHIRLMPRCFTRCVSNVAFLGSCFQNPGSANEFPHSCIFSGFWLNKDGLIFEKTDFVLYSKGLVG